MRVVVATLGTLAALLLLAGAAAAYVPHPPIGNDDLLGFPGKGTRRDPFVIEGLEIAATGAAGVNLTDTQVHVVLRDLRISNGGTRFDGIVLRGVKNVTIEDSFLEGNRNGISIHKSSQVLVRGVHVNSTAVGILLEDSTQVYVRDNVLPQNERGIQLKRSRDNTFEGNRIALASGQYGFWFADESSVVNHIPPSNLVNEVPMRWYVHGDGAHVAQARVDVKGITNYAQMLVYDSARVRIEDVLLTNGTSRGLVVLRSENVVVERVNASLNAVHGIHVNGSRRVQVLDSDASLNGGDGVRIEKPLPGDAGLGGNAVRGLVAVGNKARAVALLETSGATVHGVTGRANGAGVWANTTRELTLTGNHLTGSAGVGIDVSRAGANLTVVGNRVVGSGSDGIRLTSLGKGLQVSSNEIVDNGGRGLYLDRVVGPGVFADNRFEGNAKAGVQLRKSFHNWFERNVHEGQARSVHLNSSSHNAFADERFHKADNETALWFDDVQSYDNPVHPNSTVNGVPVQWRVRVQGTATEPVVVEDARVEVANVTNVAQIGLHNSSWVRLERPVAANGSAAGILLHQSHDVRVLDAVVRDNRGSGILVRSFSDAFGARATSNVVERAHVSGSGHAPADAGVKVQGGAAAGNVLRDSVLRDNPRAGVRLEQAGARNVLEGNEVRGNGFAGLVLDRSTLTTVQRNTFGNHSRVVDLGGSTTNLLQGNELAIDPGSFGLWFRDEASYSNDVLANTTVNGVPVQWYTFVDGREGSPVVLRPDPVELEGITNVGQVVVYKSSWVRIEGAVAANGTARGIFVVKSNQVDLVDATARASPVGVELHSTLASRVTRASVVDDGVGVLVNASSGNSVVGAVAAGTKLPVRLVGGDDNRVWATNATAIAGPTVLDDKASRTEQGGPRNLLVDAGLDLEVDMGAPVDLAGALAQSPFRNEPVVQRRWEFPDGTSEVVAPNASHPTRVFDAPGRYVLRYVVQTPTATYEDEKVVTVRPPPQGARVRLACEPAEVQALVGATVRFECSAELLFGDGFDLAVPVEDADVEVANVTAVLLRGTNATFGFDYVVPGPGERTLWVGERASVRVVAVEPTDEAGVLPSPGATLGAVAALGVAAAWRTRRRA